MAEAMPGSGNPANKALPDARRQSQIETIAITQGQLPHRAQSPPAAPILPADYIQHDPSTRSHATERVMIGRAHRCLVSLETTAVT
jgi:hypothetical protein